MAQQRDNDKRLPVTDQVNRPQDYPPPYPTLENGELDIEALVEAAKVESSEVSEATNPPLRHYLTGHTPHKWLDNYIAYSKEISPRAFQELHETCALWTLSAVVRGRAIINFGGRNRHSSLMLAVVARTSVWAKSHTIGIAEKTLQDAGLDWLLLPTKASPQAIIEEMAMSKRIITLLAELDNCEDGKQRTLKQKELDSFMASLGALAFHEGQRAWHISEFGSKIIAGMMRPGSVLADFSDFLRDINEKVGKDYTYRTRGHGLERIENPYLTIIADTTPIDLRPYAKPNAPLWSNGFFPRFCIITPDPNEQPSRARVPYGGGQARTTPVEITKPLVELNQSLGVRSSYHVPLSKITVTYSEEIWHEIYKYEDWVQANRLDTEDLDGNYTRLVFEQSVAIGMLLALIDGETEIKHHHYQRAKEICERIRRCTENFYTNMTQATSDEKMLEESRQEDKIVHIIQKHHESKGEWPTVRDIRTRTGKRANTRMSREKILKILSTLRDSDTVDELRPPGARASRYKLVI